jgi:hypothetical protein
MIRARKNGFAAIGVYLTSTALILSGCAHQAGGGASGFLMNDNGGCNPAAMAFAGALAGALLAGKNNRNQGAVAGGMIGGLACVAWNYKAKQVKTAEQVNQQYLAINKGVLPMEPRLVNYTVSSVPSAMISSGTPLVLDSVIEVVQGGSNKPVIEQELIVYHDGKVVSKARKVANAGQGAGEYLTTFTVNLPKGVPQGSYPVTSTVYLNGLQAQSRSFPVQVVQVPSDQIFASN